MPQQNEKPQPSDNEEDALASHLIHLSNEFARMRNDRNYAYLLSSPYLAPAFKVQLDYKAAGGAVTLQEHIQEYQRMIEEFPEHQVRLISSTATIDTKHGVASVFQNMELTGHPPGVVHTGMGVLEWREVGGKWVCVRLVGMRGMGFEANADQNGQSG